MKTIIIFLFLMIAGNTMAQGYFETTIIDVSGLSTDTIVRLPWKVKKQGVNVLVDFTDVNCDLLGLNVGYGPDDYTPSFVDTIPNAATPITLDKTVFANTFQGVTTHALSIDFGWYDDNYLWFGILDNAACTSGEIKIRIKDE